MCCIADNISHKQSSTFIETKYLCSFTGTICKNNIIFVTGILDPFNITMNTDFHKKK